MRLGSPLFSIWLLSLIGLASPPALAVDYCVTNAQQFRAALAASFHSGSNDEIRLAAGTYVWNDGNDTPAFEGFIANGRTLTVSGGWTSTCTSQSGNAADTVLSGGNSRPVMALRASTHALAHVRVRDLTVAHGNSNQFTPGLAINIAQMAGGSVLIERVVIRNNSTFSTSLPGGLLIRAKENAPVRIRNTLIHDNFGGRYGAINMSIQGQAFLSNNTVVRNAALGQSHHIGGVFIFGFGHATLSNNVIDGNDFANGKVQLHVSPNTGLTLRNNLINGVRSLPAQIDEQDTVAGDPRFVQAGLYLPAANSPLRNAGLAHPPGGMNNWDVAGLPRVQEGRIDIGAHEFDPRVFDGIFSNGLELP